MKDYEIADIQYDDDGAVEQFLVFWADGEPDTRRGSPENMLLFDPLDELPFDGGMHDFLSGESALQIHDDPEVLVADASTEKGFLLSVDGEVVETTLKDAEEFLRAVRSAAIDGTPDELISIHDELMSSQVRRDVVNALARTFPESRRIEIAGNGWLIDGFFLVDWEAKMYTAAEDGDDYIREVGKGAVEADQTYEFVQLRGDAESIDPDPVTINGDVYELTEREILFLSKVKWLLHRQHYHPDESFWTFTNKWADMETDEPDVGSFNI